MTVTETDPKGLAHELEALVLTLLPGNGRFPSGAEVGLQAVLADRLRQLEGQAGLDRLVTALRDAGGPLAAQPKEVRTAVVERFAAAEPALFQSVRMAAYLGYYESPSVVRAVRSLGRAYNDAPQPDGYALPPFDPGDPQQAPTHGRGRYVPTDAVTRVDLSRIPDDPLAPEDQPGGGR